VKFNTISEIILKEIRKDILSGRLPAGTKIDQNQLKDRFGISVIPLREAFKRLQSEGYIDILPHRGAYVKPLSCEEIDDIYLVRAEIEALAARLALAYLNENDLKQLDKLFSEMKKMTEEGAYEKLLTLNRKFHYIIYRASGRTHLMEILDDLWNRSSRYRNLVTVKPERAKRAIKEHQSILQACQSGDAKLLEQAVRKNVDKTREILGELFESNMMNQNIDPAT